ncbi:MAG: hypothetical protein RR515_05910 [Clostridium sp.]
MHYIKNNVHVNGEYGKDTAVNIIKENLSHYVDNKWNTIKILNDISDKIKDGEFDDMLFKQDLTQVYNCKGGFTQEEKENIKPIVINEVKNFLENSKGDINRLEGLVKDWS